MRLARLKGFLKLLNVPVPGVSVGRRVCDSLTFSVRSIVLVTPGAGRLLRGRDVRCANISYRLLREKSFLREIQTIRPHVLQLNCSRGSAANYPYIF